MPANQPAISDAELDVLKVLWKLEQGTVRDVDKELRRKKRNWAYNTVLTLLTRLREKGYVASEKTGMAYTFRAVVSRERLLKQRLVELADRVCEGTASPIVHALIDGKKLSADDIAKFRKMLDDLEQKRR